MRKISSLGASTREKRCSCCSTPEEQVHALIVVTSSIVLCDECLEVCNKILAEEGIKTTDTVKIRTLIGVRAHQNVCSVCSRKSEQVARLIAMLNNIFICNTCVGTCNAKNAPPLTHPKGSQERPVVDDQSTSS